MENEDIKFDSDLIFPKSNFWTGVASVLNVPGNFYEFKYSKNPDQDALKSDWKAVGDDLKNAQKKDTKDKKNNIFTLS